MSFFPPVTGHVLDISGDFASLQDVADAFAQGSPGYAPRVQEAVCATVISAWFNFPRHPFSVGRHLAFPDRCSRLLYAALYARAFIPRQAGKKHLDRMIARLEHGLDEGEHDLFAGTIPSPHLRTEEAVRAHIRSAMCRDDVLKAVPGLWQHDPAYREPDMSLALFLDIQKRMRFAHTKRRVMPALFAYLGAAQ